MLKIASFDWPVCHRLSVVGAQLQARCSPRQPRSPRSTTAAMSTSAGPTSARLLDRLEQVLNARDLAEATPRVAPGRLFRSGNPAHGSFSDVLLLRRDLGITHMVDLRSSEEHKEDRGWHLMLSGGCIRTYDDEGELTELAVEPNLDLDGHSLGRCDLQRLSLLERGRFIRGMMRKLPVLTVAKAAVYKALGWEDALRAVLVPEINRGGLGLVYEVVLDSAQADICRALELMTHAAQARRPGVIFCKLGKDRTGLMAALVLTCCGASEAEIVADYARSDGVDAVALGGLEKDKDLQGMDTQLFARAPPETMQAALVYAQRQYGGLASYMTSIGFGPEQQQALGKALSAEESWA